jgi:hypothetical protein
MSQLSRKPEWRKSAPKWRFIPSVSLSQKESKQAAREGERGLTAKRSRRRPILQKARDHPQISRKAGALRPKGG